MGKKKSTTEPECTEKRCCPVAFLLSALAVFVVIFLFEWVFDGIYMMPYYTATAAMWRPEAAMKSFMWVSLVRQAGTALVFTCLLTCILKAECGCPIRRGIITGIKVGLLIGLAQFGFYAWLPFSDAFIPVMWLVGNVGMGVLMGAVLGIICKCKMKKMGDCKKDGA